MQRKMLHVGRAAMACAAVLLVTGLMSKVLHTTCCPSCSCLPFTRSLDPLTLSCLSPSLIVGLLTEGEQGQKKTSLLTQKATGADFQELFIVPEANVLTGAGQRTVSPRSRGQTAASSSQHATHAASKSSKQKAAPSPQHVAKPWTKAQMQVAQSVRKAMMHQHESLEKAARTSAVKQYWSRIRASLAHEKHRLRGFRDRVEMYQARKALQDEEASDADLAMQKSRQQRLRSKMDEMSSEKAQEDQDAYEAIKSNSIDFSKCGDACKTAKQIVAGISTGSQACKAEIFVTFAHLNSFIKLHSLNTKRACVDREIGDRESEEAQHAFTKMSQASPVTRVYICSMFKKNLHGRGDMKDKTDVQDQRSTSTAVSIVDRHLQLNRERCVRGCFNLPRTHRAAS
eukprot:766081-Hanusia_phi.AAC.3